jgi:hypothetical protein
MTKLSHEGAVLLFAFAGQACAPATNATPAVLPRGAPSPPVTTTAYTTMQPQAQYTISNPDEEIALARSAAPASISAEAEIHVLGQRG